MSASEKDQAEVNSGHDWVNLRRKFVNDQLRRFSIASHALWIIATLSLLYLIVVAFKVLDGPKWEFIALLGFVTICTALPLFSKVSLSKDGGGFEVANPIELLDEMETKAQAARSESFEQTRLQISALSVQLAELTETLAKRSVDQASVEETTEPTLRDIRKKLLPQTDHEDPQKGRFGGKDSSGTRELTALVKRSDLGQNWQKLILTLRSTDGQPLSGAYAYFFLHDTFDPDVYRVKVSPGASSVSLETACKGAFTAGVAAERGNTLLELDLTADKVKAPAWWKRS
ncbi:pYEATS domain-containing protein [Mesorhizobium sp. L-2-11]|uniref:pYEATS domain-containing protein n=1 Tax=Mesorhizobium sp. L-2-11 TaxID=2744521 RepID=UPI0019270A1D|nr:pYEATS domain-containing protein [Mesorhizobium sp. L-2-11]BCH19663.1 hypothetical protein MesoLjLa_65140 [Mesorhizobium sp. L-2-11]